MKLSKIFECMGGKVEYKIYNEQEFERLQLVSHTSEQRACIFIDDIKYLKDIKENVCMILCSPEVAENTVFSSNTGICIIQKPRLVFFMIHNYLMTTTDYPRKTIPSKIAANTTIAEIAVIATNNVTIGENVIIEDFVVIKEHTSIGDGTVIRSGSIIGNNGYEFKRDDNRIMPVTHGGRVVIGKNVVIGANSVIDKAVYPWDITQIDDETKIDSLVSISHGVKIGKAVMVVAQACILGRSVVDDGAKIGPGAVIRNAVHIGEKANISMGSVVTQNAPEHSCMTGNFAINHDKFISHIKELL